MSIQRLPSGKYRAQVWDTKTGRSISVSLILAGPGTYPTRRKAEEAREQARSILKANPDKDFHRAPPAERWGIPAKGEPNCRNCGKPAVHLHHIVPRVRSRFGRHDWQRNGVPFCHTCHHGWHNRLIDVSHEILTDLEFAFACEQVGPTWVERNYPGISLTAQTRATAAPAAA